MALIVGYDPTYTCRQVLTLDELAATVFLVEERSEDVVAGSSGMVINFCQTVQLDIQGNIIFIITSKRFSNFSCMRAVMPHPCTPVDLTFICHTLHY